MSTATIPMISMISICAFLAAAPVAVHADPASTRISLAGLDLSTAAGLQAADARLAAAAKHLCLHFSDERLVDDRESTTYCFRATLADARQRLTAQLQSAGVQVGKLAQSAP